MLDTSMVKFETEELADGRVETTATGSLSRSKSARQRVFYIPAKAAEALKAYLDTKRAEDDSPALFTTRSGARLSTEQVRRMVHGYCDRLKVKRFPLREFRHRLALRLANSGCDLVTLCGVLGHSTVNSTIRWFPRLDLKVR